MGQLSKRQKSYKCWWEFGERKHLHTVMEKWISTVIETVVGIPQKWKIELPCDLAIPFSVSVHKKSVFQRDTFTPIIITALFIIPTIQN